MNDKDLYTDETVKAIMDSIRERQGDRTIPSDEFTDLELSKSVYDLSIKENKKDLS